MKGRVLLIVGLVVAVAAGAWWWGAQVAPPPTYTVVRGDTLSKIARAHEVSVDDLRRWNGISGDLIEVDQVLVVGESGGAAEAGAPASAAGQPRPKRRSTGGGRVAAAPESRPSAWTMPPEQACLAGPDPDALDAAGDEAAFAASAGLTHGQLQAAMSAHLPSLSRCLTPGQPVEGALDLEVTVACTGRVKGVVVLDDDALPADLVACVTDGLRYAAFPPHDMPDGFTFGYPMRFSP